MPDERWLDLEIERIVDSDPGLIELSQRVRASRPEPPLDPRFKAVLRAQLMREAPAALGITAPRPPRVATPSARPGWWPLRTRLAWGGVGLGAALVAATVLTVVRPSLPNQQPTVTAMSPVAERHAVSPDNVITVAFSQPMDHAAVLAGLHIRPATEISTRWQGNNLLITPIHHLAANTPYTVTIDRTAARTATGQLAAAAVRIAFGTAPTPPAAPTIAQLTPQTLSSVNDGGQLISAAGGAVIVTSSDVAAGRAGPPLRTPAPAPATMHGPSALPSATPEVSPSPEASPGASASPSAAASASASPTPSPSASPPPASAGNLVLLTARGGVVNLGPAASSAALSPNGLRVIAAVPSATGIGSSIEVVSLEGTQRAILTTLEGPVLATGWLSNSTAVVAEADRIVTVDLVGHVGTLTSLPANTTSVVFAATGGKAFASASGQDGTLIDLRHGQSRTLVGSRRTAAFSGDGSVVAWVDASGAAPRLLTSPVAHDAAVAIPLSRTGDTITAVALDRAGGHAAVIEQPSGGRGTLDVLALPSGTVIATGPDARSPVFSTAGDRIAFVLGSSVQVASVPGAPPGSTLNLLPDGAADTLRAFVDAQVAGDSAKVESLIAPGAGTQVTTPVGLTRAYVISAAPNADGTVSATARLIVDPSASRPAAAFADESLVLAIAGNGTYLVSSVSAGALHDEPVGPHVVSVLPISGPTLVLRVSFDSDLRGTTVASAITVTSRSGRTLAGTTVYDANTRTATVTLQVPSDTPVTLGVATTLVDVDGQTLAAPFTADAGG